MTDWHRHYWDGALGLAISMRDEVQQVEDTIVAVRPRACRVLVARSGGPVPEAWKADWAAEHEDLSGTLSRWEVPAASLCRNYSALARAAASFPEVDWWAFLTGDTVLLHGYGLETIAAAAGDRDLACAQAVGQDFHRADLTLEELEAGKGGGRMQSPDLADFQPQLFLARGEAVRAGLFHEIPVTNRWTTEACLGDAFMAWAGNDWKGKRHVYAAAAGEFRDGVVWHAR